MPATSAWLRRNFPSIVVLIAIQWKCCIIQKTRRWTKSSEARKRREREEEKMKWKCLMMEKPARFAWAKAPSAGRKPIHSPVFFRDDVTSSIQSNGRLLYCVLNKWGRGSVSKTNRSGSPGRNRCSACRKWQRCFGEIHRSGQQKREYNDGHKHCRFADQNGHQKHPIDSAKHVCIKSAFNRSSSSSVHYKILITWNPVLPEPWKWCRAKRNCRQKCSIAWIRFDR